MEKWKTFAWEGLTLKHVYHPKIVKPYLFYWVLACTFEIFMIGLCLYALYMMNEHQYSITWHLQIVFIFMLFMFMASVSVLIKTIQNHQYIWNKIPK